ncbi:MAG: enoyl-CoA hydratase/isomerase family protein, partial [bacterium]|nr:enoyl-CoA hydratase/isomerase family protein [bacterium]
MDLPIEVLDSPSGLKHVRLITINRQHKLNSLDGPAALSLCHEILRADHDLSVRALVIIGGGEKAFCSGADLSGIIKDESSTTERGTSAFGDLFTAMRTSGVPIISAVNGLAVGGGFGIMLASDLVVMSNKAYVGTPEVRRGLFALYISRFLYEVLPEKIANEILYLGKTLTATEAKSYNLV